MRDIMLGSDTEVCGDNIGRKNSCPSCAAKDAELERLRGTTADLRNEVEKHLSANHRLILSNADAKMENMRLRAIEARLTEEGVLEACRIGQKEYWDGVGGNPHDYIARAVIRYVKGEECTKSDSP